MALVSKRSDHCLSSVKPQLDNIVRAALEAAPAWMDFAVITGRRTTEEQQALFAKGRSEPGEIVTQCDGIHTRSRHQDGEAIDIMAWKDGRGTFNTLDVAIRAAYIIGFARGCGIHLTGGVKWGWDQGHIEVVRDA